MLENELAGIAQRPNDRVGLVDAAVRDYVGAGKKQDRADMDCSFLVVHYEHGESLGSAEKGSSTAPRSKATGVAG